MKKNISKLFILLILVIFTLTSCDLINNATMNFDGTKPIKKTQNENSNYIDRDKDSDTNVSGDKKKKNEDGKKQVSKNDDTKVPDKKRPGEGKNKDVISHQKHPNSNKNKPKNKPSKQDKQPENNTEVEPSKVDSSSLSVKPGKNHNEKANSYAYSVSDVKDKMYDTSFKEKKIAFLTFDDGLNNVITPRVLDTLKEKKVPATFFAIGSSINDDNKDILKRVYDEGHGLATHSTNHDYSMLYPYGKADADYIVSEYKDQLGRYRKYLGDDFDTKVWRYPGGHMSWRKKPLRIADEALANLGVNWVDWNSMNGDTQSKSITNINDIPRPHSIDDAVRNVRISTQLWGSPNVIVVLMHDAPDKTITADSLAQVIEFLKNEGYEFGILS
ncbi:MAG: polysaccharide deacetylase family protein [Tissierellia bacterium]|nr:polysaccharide deacetylase family protein [Tissierellia bacterium]